MLQKIKNKLLRDMFFNDSGKRILSRRQSKIDALDAVPHFPVLSEDYLRFLTFGVYQIKQAFSYKLENLDDGGMIGKTMPIIIQGKNPSRHVYSKSYYLWVQFDSKGSSGGKLCPRRYPSLVYRHPEAQGHVIKHSTLMPEK